jgi:hypothetical protein
LTAYLYNASQQIRGVRHSLTPLNIIGKFLKKVGKGDGNDQF